VTVEKRFTRAEWNAFRNGPPPEDVTFEAVEYDPDRHGQPPDEENGNRPAERALVLEVQSVAEIVAALDAAPRTDWLLRAVWPADAYGVLAAVDKAGKSLLGLDLAVSVASGTPWLGVYDVDRPGPVLIFYGEGSHRRVIRRLRAICEPRGVELGHLPIRLSTRVPHLTSREHLDAVTAEVTGHTPVLVILDPLYLAARGAKGSDLYAMGETLEGVQHVCDGVGAALLVVTHFTKGGNGRGAQRITGVGPGAWGRVLITAHVEHRHTEPDTRATIAVLGLDFIGDEIPDSALRIRRRVWADDPDDLDSRLHYDVEVVQDEPPTDPGLEGLSPSAQRILALLRSTERDQSTVKELGDDLAAEGRPLKKRTIQTALGALAEMQLADSTGDGPGLAARWWAT
jgi:hypothetical protein